jgi:S-adenosylmethionine:tRNA-ribosyltransferase-isomerase (queuine synthetase)
MSQWVEAGFEAVGSTLLMPISALMGLDVMREAYAHAIEKEYRFYSYGVKRLGFSGGGLV